MQLFFCPVSKRKKLNDNTKCHMYYKYNIIVQFQLIKTFLGDHVKDRNTICVQTQSKAKQNFHMTRKDTEIEFMDVDETTS